MTSIRWQNYSERPAPWMRRCHDTRTRHFPNVVEAGSGYGTDPPTQQFRRFPPPCSQLPTSSLVHTRAHVMGRSPFFARRCPVNKAASGAGGGALYPGAGCDAGFAVSCIVEG